jgi:hypothetical protein
MEREVSENPDDYIIKTSALPADWELDEVWFGSSDV